MKYQKILFNVLLIFIHISDIIDSYNSQITLIIIYIYIYENYCKRKKF